MCVRTSSVRKRTAPISFALAALVAVVISAGCATQSNPSSTRSISVRRGLANSLLHDPKVSLATFHVSGWHDRATALDNMRQAATGRSSRRSSYQRAPGGSTYLDNRMLRAMKGLIRDGYSFRVTELAGGSHSSKSRHYAGAAFDVDYINGIKVGWGNPYHRRFMKRCRQLGASDVRGPGDRGHRSHVHVEWPR